VCENVSVSERDSEKGRERMGERGINSIEEKGREKERWNRDLKQAANAALQNYLEFFVNL
jgi:hypothetical protein